MRIFDIANKDFRQLVRDWQTLFFLLVMPVIFTLMFGFLFSGGGDSVEDARLPVGYLDLDKGALSPDLMSLLSESTVIRMVDTGAGRSELEEAVLDDELAAAVIVPAGFSQLMMDGESIPLIVIVSSGSSSGYTIQGETQAVAMRLKSAVRGAQISVDNYEGLVGFGDEDAREAYFEEGLARNLVAWESPPVSLEISYTGAVAEQTDESTEVFGENPFSHSSAAMMAQFAVAGLMGAASLLVLERKNGTMQRLMTTNLSRAEYLFGHYLTMFLMVFAQLLLLTLFGHLVLDVGYYRDPGATIPLIIVSALFSASLGLLIGAVSKKEEHVIILSLVLMMLLAGLGGAWVPLEFASESFQRIAHFTPLAWMVDGFKDIIIRGLGLRAILPAIYVLFTFAVGLFFLAVWRFRSL